MNYAKTSYANMLRTVDHLTDLLIETGRDLLKKLTLYKCSTEFLVRVEEAQKMLNNLKAISVLNKNENFVYQNTWLNEMPGNWIVIFNEKKIRFLTIINKIYDKIRYEN